MATPTDNVVGVTGNPLIDGLTWGAAWQFGGGAHTLSYSLSLNDNPTGGGWTTALSDAVRQALAEWSNVANLAFVESGSGGVYDQSPADLAFILTGNELQPQMTGLVGLGLPPSPSLVNTVLAAAGETRLTYRQPEGDIALDNYYSGFSYLNPGGVGLEIMLHEIGHALGLKHTDDGSGGRPTFASLGIANLDSNLYTVMSYTDPSGQQFGINPSAGNAATPMPLDILAIQQIYGANTSYHTGDDNYYLLQSGGQVASVITIWDAGGIDTLNARSYASADTTSSTIDLREGHVSSLGGTKVAIAYGAVIENATGGAGNDTLLGNVADNRLDGGTGNDFMSAGAGNDTYVVDSVDDVVTENPGEGTDTIVSLVTYTLSANVENLTLAGSGRINAAGNAQDNILLGNAAGNVLSGGGGNDTIDGGGGLDTMVGGTGNDTYIVSGTGTGQPNMFALSGEPGSYYVNGGTASVPLSPPPSFTLQDRTGDGLIDYIFIYSFTSEFSLTVGSNQLGQNLAAGTYANAERAAFATAGHAGLDLGYVGIGANQIFGNFTIDAMSIDYGGAAPVLQDLALTFEIHPESASAAAVFGTFNYNYFGGAATPEAVIELANQGTDEVRASVSYVLPDNVENLTLTGTGAINGTGNTLDNQITGNAANNSLVGGAGNDTLDGGAGNDKLYGDAGTDILRGGAGDDTFYFADSDGNDQLLGGDGFDTLDFSTLNGVIQANQFNGVTTGTAGNDTLVDIFEMLIGTRFGDVLAGGNGGDGLKGGAGDDQIWGNGGDDWISGGDGNDRIKLGQGNDVVDFRNGDDIDTILDFYAGAGIVDRIQLKNYFGLGTNTLAGMQSQGRITQVGADTQIALNVGDMLILKSVLATNLHADDFIFA